MKWFFCLNAVTLNRKGHDFKTMAIVAVNSCLKNTSLEPHLLYDGNPDDFTDMMEKLGVTIHYHRSVLYNELLEKYSTEYDRTLKEVNLGANYYLDISLGAFLRFDIPLFCIDDYYIYTDTDVMFLKGIDTNPDILSQIKNFMVAPQADQESLFDDINSGVLVCNTEHMKQNYFGLINYARNNIPFHNQYYLDQEILREFYYKDHSLLNLSYNWKPYWGINDNATIIHWHGPKPIAISELLRGVPIESSMANNQPSWVELYNSNPDAYQYYLDIYESYIPDPLPNI